MEKTSQIKKAMLKVTFVAIVILVASCNYNQRPEDTKDVAEEHNDAKFANNNQEKDAQFLVDAAGFNLKQIHLGQLAQQNGITTHVKELGKMMVDGHTKSLNDLRALAKSKTITIPTSPTDEAKDDYKKLNEKSRSDFDQAYADLMVTQHEDAIDVVEKASKDSYDTEIKNWATAALPDLRKHLDHSIDCQKKCDNLKLNG